MTYLQALYGSQHLEITKNGKDGAKGRTNGNIFLSVFIMLVVFVITLGITHFSSSANHEMTSGVQKMFPYSTGKAIGKLLAIPLIAVIYFVVIKTAGTERNYKKLVEEFYQLPESEQSKANQKILIPFFILLALMLVFVI